MKNILLINFERYQINLLCIFQQICTYNKEKFIIGVLVGLAPLEHGVMAYATIS